MQNELRTSIFYFYFLPFSYSKGVKVPSGIGAVVAQLPKLVDVEPVMALIKGSIQDSGHGHWGGFGVLDKFKDPTHCGCMDKNLIK